VQDISIGSALNDLSAGPRRRSTAAKSRRRPGINYDAIPPGLQEVTIEPGDSDYQSVASTYLRSGSPGVVIQPRTPSEVAEALAFARAHTHLPLGIRSAGHGISGRSTNDGGLVIDLRKLDPIEILDQEKRLVRIGPGATWKKVARALDPYGWALSSGDYGGVGVGGLATAGGIGFLSREFGLTIDRLRAVEMVLADGSIVRASPQENSELFWGVRGAGANLGVVTSFDFEACDVGDVGWAQLRFASSNIEQALASFGEVVSRTPRDTTIFLVTGRPHRGFSTVQLYGLVNASDPDIIGARLTPFLQVGSLVDQQVVITRYAEVMGLAADVGPDGQHGFGQPVSRSAFLPRMTTEFARAAAWLLRTGDVYFFQLRSMGGAIADVAPDATAFAHRDAAFQVTAMGADRDALDLAWDKLLGHFDGLYLSFETDLRPERLERAFPAPVLARLRQLKLQVDPENLLRDNFNIDPAATTPAERLPDPTHLRNTA
jgi:FAD binding domain